jgi:hypothetical protein
MRTVLEDEIVSIKIGQEQAKYPRFGEAIDALKWWLQHRPDSGDLIDDIHWLYKQDGDIDQNIPMLSVIYTFDAYFVTLKFLTSRMPLV